MDEKLEKYFKRYLELIEYRLSDNDILEYGRNCVISFLNEIYLAGRAEQSKRDREAVKKIDTLTMEDEHFKRRAIAALEAAAIKEIK